jgi:hypothetical protein
MLIIQYFILSSTCFGSDEAILKEAKCKEIYKCITKLDGPG